MKKLLLGLASSVLILSSCNKNEAIDNVNNDRTLKFSPVTGMQTKASEITNPTLKTGATDLNPMVISAFQYKSSAWATWFADELSYDNTNSVWKIASTRFQNANDTKFITYWPATGVTQSSTTFTTSDFTSTYPKFAYIVNATTDKQLDLIGGVTDVAAKNTDVVIKTRHLLSQVNFGVRAYEGAKITIKDIKIMQVSRQADFTYKDADAAPLGSWGNHSSLVDYTYLFGVGNTFTTSHVATEINTGDTYIFGDGGKWGPGTGATTYYVLADGSAKKEADLTENNKLGNSAMLLPQKFDAGASQVTFKYSITDADDAPVVAETEGSFDLNFGNGANALYGSQWLQNYRYVYIIDFTDMLDDNKLTFTVDVETESWENYNNTDPDDDGIVDIQVIGSTARPIMDALADGGVFYFAKNSATQTDDDLNVQVINNSEWDWTGYTFKKLTSGQSVSLDFIGVAFNGHTITLDLPADGFTYSTDGGLTYTATSPITIDAATDTVHIKKD